MPFRVGSVPAVRSHVGGDPPCPDTCPLHSRRGRVAAPHTAEVRHECADLNPHGIRSPSPHSVRLTPRYGQAAAYRDQQNAGTDFHHAVMATSRCSTGGLCALPSPSLTWSTIRECGVERFDTVPIPIHFGDSSAFRG